jgi:hypothetical protein
MPPVTNREKLSGAIGVVLLIGVLLRVWHFVGGRSLWMDETMVALNIIHLSPSGLMGPLSFDQLAPAGWLLLEKASLQLWGDFEYTLRLPALIGGIAALFLFYRFLKYAAGAWETLAGVALLAFIPTEIQYSSMVKPYILDVLFTIAVLHASLVLLREQRERLRRTVLLGMIGVLCIPLSFGGTLAMAGAGVLLFIASVMKKERAWSLALVTVGIIWGLLSWAVYSLCYAHNGHTIANMAGLYWTDSFAPLPISLHGLAWYPSAAIDAIKFLMSNPNTMAIIVIWLYGVARMTRVSRWLPALLISPAVATLIASMLGLYPFSTRLILGLAPSLIFGVACGAVGIVEVFSHRRLASVAMFALLLYSPMRQTAAAASHWPPFPMEDIKPNLAYLGSHFRPGDQLILYPSSEPPFLLYAERFGLSARDFKVISYFRRDQSCVYDSLRLIRDQPRAWVLFYHFIDADRPGMQFLQQALKLSGSLTVADVVRGSELYLYTAGSRPDAIQFPPSAVVCSQPRHGSGFLDRIRQHPASPRAAD